MVSDRLRDPHGLATVAAAVGLVATGATIVWALRYGFYGTMLFAGLVAAWLAVILWWRTVEPRAAAATTTGGDDGDDGEAERVVLRALLDQAPGALLAVAGNRVRALNRAARLLFDTDDRVLPPPPALLSDDAARLRHGGRSWRIDRVTIDRVGTVETLVALIDVEAAEHAAEARATRELLRVLGHEVMNAMAPITSLAESALAVLAAPERRDRLLPEILDTLARRADGLRRFTEAYRQVARLPDPVPVAVPVAALFADIVHLFEAQWRGGASLSTDDPGDAVATLDRDQIVQALLALLRNAVEAMQAAGVPPVARLTAIVAPDRLTLRVRDEGPGVDPVHRTAIFLPFFTTKADGNGIGLAAARQIAQGHGGDVTLCPGRPTTFELSLPR